MLSKLIPRIAFIALTMVFAVYTYVISTRGEVDYQVIVLYSGLSFLIATGAVVWEWRYQRQLARELVAMLMGVSAGLFTTLIVLVIAVLFLMPSQSLRNEGNIQTIEQAFWASLWDLQLWVPLLLSVCIFVGVTVVLQTRNDFRFLIPYIDFSQRGTQEGGLLLDSSTIIDGRIVDICQTRIVTAPLIIPDFVLRELQTLADSKDKLKRDRGRRGLDMVSKLQTMNEAHVVIRTTDVPQAVNVDDELLRCAKEIHGRILTTDFNLNKVGQIEGVTIINVNDLANAMKPQVLPGSTLQLAILRPGQEPDQGVGYLDDGTMVVVENGRDRIGQTLEIAITGSIQTSAGRMIFGRPKDEMPEGDTAILPHNRGARPGTRNGQDRNA